jgi:hypothetical protein
MDLQRVISQGTRTATPPGARKKNRVVTAAAEVGLILALGEGSECTL